MIRALVGGLIRRARLHAYDDFSIAEHFALQGARIGKDCRLEVRSLGTEPFLVSIGDHCTIAFGVEFLTHDGGVWVFSGREVGMQKFGRIDILDNCFIGAKSIIMGSTTIGPNAVVGAGSVVTKTVPENTIVAGNPARVIRSLDEYYEKAKAAWNIQCPPDYFKGLPKAPKPTSRVIDNMKSRDRHLLRSHLIRVLGEGPSPPSVSGEGSQ